MQVLQVVGIVERKGSWDNGDYHNVYLHCTRSDEYAIGKLTEIVKIKYSEHESILGKQYSPEDWNNLLDKKIIPMYDRFGQVIYIRFVDNK